MHIVCFSSGSESDYNPAVLVFQSFMAFKEINWLPVEHRVAQIKLSLVFRIVNGSAPEYLQNDFNHVGQVHRYSTSHSESSLCVPYVKR